jgi:hypothetical protein
MGVGVAIDAFLGVEPECGLAALGVAIVLNLVPVLYLLGPEFPAQNRPPDQGWALFTK